MVKNMPFSAVAAKDMDLSLGLGRFFRGGNGNPLQYSCQDNPMDRGIWQATVHRFAELDMTEQLTLTHIEFRKIFFSIQEIYTYIFTFIYTVDP